MGLDNEAKLAKALEVKDFFPKGCSFHWDGTGQVPIATKMLFKSRQSLADVCRNCRKTGCEVRVAGDEPQH